MAFDPAAVGRAFSEHRFDEALGYLARNVRWTIVGYMVLEGQTRSGRPAAKRRPAWRTPRPPTTAAWWRPVRTSSPSTPSPATAARPESLRSPVVTSTSSRANRSPRSRPTRSRSIRNPRARSRRRGYEKPESRRPSRTRRGTCRTGPLSRSTIAVRSMVSKTVTSCPSRSSPLAMEMPPTPAPTTRTRSRATILNDDPSSCGSDRRGHRSPAPWRDAPCSAR